MDNLSHYTAVDPFLMTSSGNTDTVTLTETSFAQVMMNKAISGTMGGGGVCEANSNRNLRCGLWRLITGWLFPLQKGVNLKDNNEDFDIFITA